MHPSDYHEDLTEDRLVYLAQRILEQVNLTYETTDTEYDDAWDQGCTIFARVKNMLKALGAAAEPRWLKLAKDGMDITPIVGSVPFRFATDNPDAPRKARILLQNNEEMKQLGFAFDDMEDLVSSEGIYKWRWYIKKAHLPEDRPTVHFVGLNHINEPVCSWSYDGDVPAIHSVGGKTPLPKPVTEAPVHVPAAKVSIKQPSKK